MSAQKHTKKNHLKPIEPNIKLISETLFEINASNLAFLTLRRMQLVVIVYRTQEFPSSCSINTHKGTINRCSRSKEIFQPQYKSNSSSSHHEQGSFTSRPSTCDTPNLINNFCPFAHRLLPCFLPFCAYFFSAKTINEESQK